MQQEKVTRQELRDMRVGQTRIIILDEKKKIESARQTITQLRNTEDLDFIFKPDYSACAVSITRVK